jgi:hypothetical protein
MIEQNLIGRLNWLILVILDWRIECKQATVIKSKDHQLGFTEKHPIMDLYGCIIDNQGCDFISD